MLTIDRVAPWPLMANNVLREDREAVIALLRDDSSFLTQSRQVAAFEEAWSGWLGVKYSVLVNSGSSANLLSLTALREHRGLGEVIVPPLTWVSDIASVLQCGFTPVFADISLPTLGMATEAILDRLTPSTKAVFLTHILGYNALTARLLQELAARGVDLIEDVCESHGATFGGRKLGTFGVMSCFSFYYAHHMSTIEGGMICTDDPALYQTLRMLRAHGMVRESSDMNLRAEYAGRHADLNPDFIFAMPAYNVRSTELQATIGLSQLPRLDANNAIRRRNLERFLAALDPVKYFTEFAVEGSCNYALTLLLRHPDEALRDRVVALLQSLNIEARRGMSGGGNQLRQPYLRRLLGDAAHRQYPNTDHVHFFGFYLGNYPDLDPARIDDLCRRLNDL